MCIVFALLLQYYAADDISNNRKEEKAQWASIYHNPISKSAVHCYMMKLNIWQLVLYYSILGDDSSVQMKYIFIIAK